MNVHQKFPITYIAIRFPLEWVNWVVNQLHRAEGIRSTSQPESLRDQVPKRSNPPLGWYNFDEKSGKQLLETKKKRDPKNIFSLTSRVSCLSGSKFSSREQEYDENNVVSQTSQVVRDGEISPSDCMTPKIVQRPDLRETVLESMSTDDVDDIDETFGEGQEVDINENFVDKNDEDSNEEHSVSSDLRRLLTLASDDDDDFKNWKFSNSTLGRIDSDDDSSPRSVDDYQSF